MKSFYPNVAYNKNRRKKFLIYFIVAMILLAGLLSVFIINDPKSFTTWILGFCIVFILILLPGVLKAYPVNGKSVIDIDEKTVTYGGKYSVELKDVIKVKVNVMVEVSSKLKPEIEEQLKHVAANLEDEEFFGDVDLTIKGKKKEEQLCATVTDCVGALQALVDFGVKDYEINVFSGKVSVKSNYKFYKSAPVKEEKDMGLSRKERIKQLL